MDIAHFIIPSFVIFVMFAGSWLTQKGMHWYQTIAIPKITPPSWVFSVVWMILYILLISSAIMWWDSLNQSWFERMIIAGLFLLNGMLNVSWSYFFFYRHMIGLPILISVGLQTTLLTLIYLLWPINWVSALLLIPYALWMIFAIAINIGTWWLN